MADAQTRALARRLRTLEKARLGAKQPTLGFSTIDDGAITATDVDGNLTMIIGKQYDETSAPVVVTGPTPPAPQAAFVTEQSGALRIYWDGTFEAAQVAPMDFSRVLAYAVPLAEFTVADPLNQTAIVGEFNTATGGEITAGLNPGVEYVVWLVTWSQAGKFSPPSAAVTATTGTSITSYTVEYAVGASETVAPVSGWSTDSPVRTPGTFVWVRTTTHTDGGADVVGSPALVTGNTGAPGAQGPQGVPGSAGTPGTPGASLFTWVKYADTPTTGMSDSPTGKTYMGIAYNKTTATESSTYSDYEWSLIKGTDGIAGPPGSDGSSLYTWVKYATSSSGAGMSDDPTGKTYIGFAYNKTTATESSTASDYAWSLIQGPQGPQGTPGSQGVQGPPGADGATTYTWLKYADSPTTGMSDSPTGKTYMGLAPNKTTATESTNYADYTWSLIQGPQGNQGVPGTPGSSLYTWVKYADTATGTGMSDSPTGKAFIGLAYNKTSATESTTASDYTWSRIVGEASDLAVPGAATQLEVIEGIGAFYVRWVPPSNPDKMTFEVHAVESATMPVSAPTPGNAASLVAEVSGFSTTVRSMPGKDPATGEPNRFKYTTEPNAEDPTAGDHPYWFSVIAKDIDGPGTASSWVDGRMYQITGPDVRANTIKGENIFGGTLTGDLFSGTVLLGSTISTGQIDDTTGSIVGARSELGPDGIYTYDGTNKPIVKFPTDGSGNAFVRADFEMLSAKVLDNFSMFGLNNSIGKDGRLMLAAGVAPPSAPPTISYEYDQVQLDTTTTVSPQSTSFGNLGKIALDPSQINSIAWNSDWAVFEVCQQKSGGFRIWHFNADGSITTNIGTGKPWVDDYEDRTDCTNAWGGGTGATRGGAVLFKSGGVWYFWGPTEINVIPNSWILDVDARPPVLGYDSVNNRWMIAQSNGGGNGTFHVRFFSVNHYSGTGAFPNATSITSVAGEAASGLGKRPNGIYYGPGDFSGGNRYVWNVEDYTTVYVFNGSTLQDNEGSYEMWTKPEAGMGICWNGTQFVSIGATGRVTRYPNWNWTTLSSQAYVGASAYDSDTLGDTANPHVGQTAGQHETPVGSIASFSQRRRAKLVITMPETPDAGGTDDVDKWKLYYARQTTTPTKTQFKYVDMIGSPTARTSKTMTADATGGNPPGGVFGQVGAVNNFPSANPAKLISVGLDSLQNPVIELNGDGAGRLGPFKWDKNGNDSNDTGWIAMSLQNGWVNYGAPYTTAAYRRIGKVVYLKGLVKDGTATAVITTLPVGFRPMGGVANNNLIMVGGQNTRVLSIPDLAAKNTSGTNNGTTPAHTHTVGSYTLTGSISNAAGRIDVDAAGNISSPADPGSWVALNGMSFLID